MCCWHDSRLLRLRRACETAPRCMPVLAGVVVSSQVQVVLLCTVGSWTLIAELRFGEDGEITFNMVADISCSASHRRFVVSPEPCWFQRSGQMGAPGTAPNQLHKCGLFARPASREENSLPNDLIHGITAFLLNEEVVDMAENRVRIGAGLPCPRLWCSLGNERLLPFERALGFPWLPDAASEVVPLTEGAWRL